MFFSFFFSFSFLVPTFIALRDTTSFNLFVQSLRSEGPKYILYIYAIPMDDDQPPLMDCR